MHLAYRHFPGTGHSCEEADRRPCPHTSFLKVGGVRQIAGRRLSAVEQRQAGGRGQAGRAVRTGASARAVTVDHDDPASVPA